jgi:hypothetical protein
MNSITELQLREILVGIMVRVDELEAACKGGNGGSHMEGLLDAYNRVLRDFEKAGVVLGKEEDDQVINWIKNNIIGTEHEGKILIGFSKITEIRKEPFGYSIFGLDEDGKKIGTNIVIS